jgi:hypothetical protein
MNAIDVWIPHFAPQSQPPTEPTFRPSTKPVFRSLTPAPGSKPPPFRRLRNPGSDGGWRPTVLQLPGDALGHEHATVERSQHVDRSDQDEVMQGTGVGHNDHARRSAFRISSLCLAVARS